MLDPQAPAGAQAKLDGLYYKIGRHEKVFFHNGIEWLLSSKPKSEVEKWRSSTKQGRGD